MKTTLIISCILLPLATISYAQIYQEEIREFQDELNKNYSNPEESPLTKKDLKKFKGLPFFPINENYKVVAQLQRAVNALSFQMQTTTSRLPTYEVYGVATFEIDGKEYKLNIYQSHGLRETEEYKDYLFLPFTDLTSADETYGGGRYIDLKIPDGDTIIIDFNKAYNPYCAYNPNYSCPIPPKENNLNVKILAGVKYK